MSGIRFSTQADKAIAEARRIAEAEGPNSPEARLSLRLGYVEASFRGIAAAATVHSQLGQVAGRIATVEVIDADIAVTLLESLCAGLRRKYGDDRLGEILPVLRDGRDMLNELIAVEQDACEILAGVAA